MTTNTEPLYMDKYKVIRTNGSSEPGGKHHGCRYFVLDLEHDKYAKDALAAYATACEADFPTLAADIRMKLLGWAGRLTP